MSDLYTAVIEYNECDVCEGKDRDCEICHQASEGTYCIQIEASNFDELIGKLTYRMTLKLNYEDDMLDYDFPVEIDGLKNVWCITFLDANDRFFMVTLIKTGRE